MYKGSLYAEPADVYSYSFVSYCRMHLRNLMILMSAHILGSVRTRYWHATNGGERGCDAVCCQLCIEQIPAKGKAYSRVVGDSNGLKFSLQSKRSRQVVLSFGKSG